MTQDPNELHVAMSNKSIKVGGFSAGEQLYDFVVGWCYLIYFYFGYASLTHLKKVPVTAVPVYSWIHTAWLPHWSTSQWQQEIQSYTFIVEIIDLWDVFNHQISDADERTILYPGAFNPFRRGQRGEWGKRTGRHTLGMWTIFRCTSWICCTCVPVTISRRTHKNVQTLMSASSEKTKQTCVTILTITKY